MSKQAFHDLRIQSIEKETEGSSRIRFALPETLLDEFHFKLYGDVLTRLEMEFIKKCFRQSKPYSAATFSLFFNRLNP